MLHKKGTKRGKQNLDVKQIEQKVEDLVLFAFNQIVEKIIEISKFNYTIFNLFNIILIFN